MLVQSLIKIQNKEDISVCINDQIWRKCIETMLKNNDDNEVFVIIEPTE